MRWWWRTVPPRTIRQFRPERLISGLKTFLPSRVSRRGTEHSSAHRTAHNRQRENSAPPDARAARPESSGCACARVAPVQFRGRERVPPIPRLQSASLDDRRAVSSSSCPIRSRSGRPRCRRLRPKWHPGARPSSRGHRCHVKVEQRAVPHHRRRAGRDAGDSRDAVLQRPVRQRARHRRPPSPVPASTLTRVSSRCLQLEPPPRRPRRRAAAADRHVPGAGRTCRAPCAAPRTVCRPTARNTRPADPAGLRHRASPSRAGGRCGLRSWCAADHAAEGCMSKRARLPIPAQPPSSSSARPPNTAARRFEGQPTARPSSGAGDWASPRWTTGGGRERSRRTRMPATTRSTTERSDPTGVVSDVGSGLDSEAFSSVTAKDGRTARARSTNSRTASYSPSPVAGTCAAVSGRPSGDTATTCSPDTRSSARLVTNAVIPGHATRRSTRAGPPGRTCSKLSSTSRSRVPYVEHVPMVASGHDALQPRDDDGA